MKWWETKLISFQVIRHYHGHLSGVYCLALHPTIDVLLTGGRDSVCRVDYFTNFFDLYFDGIIQVRFFLGE